MKFKISFSFIVFASSDAPSKKYLPTTGSVIHFNIISCMVQDECWEKMFFIPVSNCFSTICWKGQFSPFWIPWQFYWISMDETCVSLYMKYLLCFTCLYDYPKLIWYIFSHYNFVVRLEVRSLSSNFIFLFQIYLVYSRFFA